MNIASSITGFIKNADKKVNKSNSLKQSNENPSNLTLEVLFEQQVIKTPDAQALVFEGQSLTYQLLNEKANQLAHQLISLGIKPQTLIGVCLERGPNLLVTLLAIIKAGGVYVPIDPIYPDARIEYTIDDAQIKVLFIQSDLKSHYEQIAKNKNLILIESNDNSNFANSKNNPNLSLSAMNLAYVIYTSGSTGKPKGVCISHASVLNTLFAIVSLYKNLRINESPLKVTAITSISFDVSLAEFLVPLFLGDTLHLLSTELRNDPFKIAQYIQNNEINLVYLPPAILSYIPENDYPSLRSIIYAGEPCNSKTASYWSKKVKLFNFYGPTETAIYATGLQLHDNEVTLIGKPIPNVTCYVLDGQLKPQPIGVVGELYITGAGLAQGYLNRPDLTAQRFIENPFSKTGERMYQTGDLCRFLPDGNIEYIGRTDNQVKIRGYRVELGEIEFALNEHEAIKDCAVLACEDGPNLKYLVAYVLFKDQKNSIKTEQLQTFLELSLPSFMVPRLFIILDQMPLTPNGKLDRKALPLPGRLNDLRQFTAPQTPIETYLAQLWSQHLGINQISRNDNLAELGGDSLVITQVVSQIKQEMDVTIRRVYFYSCCLAEIASLISGETSFNEKTPFLNQVKHKPLLFGKAGREKFGILHQVEPSASFGIVICPPLFQDYMRLHKLMRNLADSLTKQKTPVFRFDFYGQGDSDGDSQEITFNRLCESLKDAVHEFKVLTGLKKIVLIAFRASAFVVDEIIDDLPEISQVILIDPVLKGSEYINSLRDLESKMWKYKSISPQLIRNETVEELLGTLYSTDFLNELVRREGLRNHSYVCINIRNHPGWDDYTNIGGYHLSPSLIEQMDTLIAEMKS